jgi:hypothetical protein
MTTPQLRAADHPDLSDVLTHFTGRARHDAAVELWIQQMQPADRLNSILREGLLRPAVTYSGGQPAICFTESTKPGLAYLIQQTRFAPWGIVLDRQWIYDHGGAPVWHYRPEDEPAVKALPDRLRTWTVRLSTDPDRPSDWLHEREWRIPLLNGPLPLEPAAIKAIIVGHESWAPEPVELPVECLGFPNEHEGDFDTIGPVMQPRLLPPPCWAGKTRWLWRPENNDLLPLPQT